MSDIKENEYTFLSSDGKTDIRVREWAPKTDARAIVQIAHGVAEHIDRYDEFARFLASQGIAVAANDHLGHGKSVGDDGCLGFFADTDGWDKIISDMESLRKKTAEKYQEVPYFIFGHSMGSFAARTYLIKYPMAPVRGMVLSGTGQNSSFIVGIGASVSASEIKKFGVKGKSEKMNRLAFGGYNKPFRPNRTAFDWLSKNTENVDRYTADPLCGYVCTAGLFRDLMHGLKFISSAANLRKMNKQLPVFFISGDEDPVGGMGKGVKKTAAMFERAGMRKVTTKLYPGYRHELLNEDIKEDVMRDILEWLDKNITA